MTALINRTDFVSLSVNLLLAVGSALAINTVVFGLFLAGDVPEPAESVSFAPPGAVIGAVWVGLFAMMGAARWALNSSGERAENVKRWICILLLFCVAYPFYTLGLTSELLGFFGNLATIALTVFVVARAWRFSRTASILLMPIVVWVSFATVIILAELRWI